MDRRASLSRIIWILSLVGMVFLTIPYLKSCLPNSVKESNRPRLELKGIDNGDFRILEHPLPMKLGAEFVAGLLVYRTHLGEYKIWDIPVSSGAVGMPDINWWSPFYLCRNFGPTKVNSIVDESLPIKCHDPELPEWWAKEWLWDINGNCLGKIVSDMKRSRGKLVGDRFLLK